MKEKKKWILVPFKIMHKTQDCVRARIENKSVERESNGPDLYSKLWREQAECPVSEKERKKRIKLAHTARDRSSEVLFSRTHAHSLI